MNGPARFFFTVRWGDRPVYLTATGTTPNRDEAPLFPRTGCIVGLYRRALDFNPVYAGWDTDR